MAARYCGSTVGKASDVSPLMADAGFARWWARIDVVRRPAGRPLYSTMPYRTSQSSYTRTLHAKQVPQCPAIAQPAE